MGGGGVVGEEGMCRCLAGVIRRNRSSREFVGQSWVQARETAQAQATTTHLTDRTASKNWTISESCIVLTDLPDGPS